MCSKPKVDVPEPLPPPPEAPRLPDQTPIQGESRQAMGTLLTGGTRRAGGTRTLLGG